MGGHLYFADLGPVFKRDNDIWCNGVVRVLVVDGEVWEWKLEKK